MQAKKNIVIIGAGYGGVKSAKVLHKSLKKYKDHEITIIDKNPYHTLMTELHEVAGGKLEPDALKIYLKKIFAGKRVNVVTDEVTTIDFDKKIVNTTNTNFPYDYLIIGTGAEPVFFGIPGVQENCFTLWSLDDAIRIKEHIEKMFLLASRETDAARKQAYLTFTVAGAGLTGIELIGELLNWKKKLCERFYIDEDSVSLKIVEAQKTILPTLPTKLQLKTQKYLEKKKIEILTECPITEVSGNSLFIKNKEAFKSDTIIWTCGVHGGTFAGKLNLTKGKCIYYVCEIASSRKQCMEKNCRFNDDKNIKDKYARIQVNEYMQSVDHPEVYIIGDIVWHKENEVTIPQIVETALQTGETAAKNIVRDIQGKEKEKFKSNYHGQMVSIGSHYGVANLMNVQMSGFIALAMKHLINLHYLLEVTGINQIWEYLRHHFLDVHDNRSLIGGHAAVKTKFYWIILLRLLLGTMWIIEGGTKVAEGWLNPNNIKIVKMPTAQIYTPEATDDQYVDATTEASEAVVEEPVATIAPVDATTEASEMVAEEAPAEGTTTDSTTTKVAAATSYPKAIMQPLAIYKWFERTVIVKFAFLFQSVIVIAEILIGLALVGGLFTFVASAASIGLALMFIVSGMATKEIFWFIFAALVMMGGAGKSFGLDYWVMPWLKKWWNGRRIAWRTYTYIDHPVLIKKKKK